MNLTQIPNCLNNTAQSGSSAQSRSPMQPSSSSGITTAQCESSGSGGMNLNGPGKVSPCKPFELALAYQMAKPLQDGRHGNEDEAASVKSSNGSEPQSILEGHPILDDDNSLILPSIDTIWDLANTGLRNKKNKKVNEFYKIMSRAQEEPISGDSSIPL